MIKISSKSAAGIGHLDGASSKRRPGTTSFETIVAFGLLTTVLTVFAPLVVRHDRLLISHRQYRLALDELSNQLERLTSLPAGELDPALEELAPSPFAAARLRGAELRSELKRLDIGQRLTLQLTWDESQRRAAPVTLSAWIFPSPQEQAVRANDTAE